MLDTSYLYGPEPNTKREVSASLTSWSTALTSALTAIMSSGRLILSQETRKK